MYRHYDELYHHGILGMSWGHRNGPPYPIPSGRHSAAEKREMKKAKKEARRKKVHSRDAHTMYKYRDEFTTKEINDALDRFGAEKKLTELTKPDLYYTVNMGAKYAKSLAGITTDGIKVYNSVVDVMNTFAPREDGRPYKRIETKDKKKDGKKED